MGPSYLTQRCCSVPWKRVAVDLHLNLSIDGIVLYLPAAYYPYLCCGQGARWQLDIFLTELLLPTGTHNPSYFCSKVTLNQLKRCCMPCLVWTRKPLQWFFKCSSFPLFQNDSPLSGWWWSRCFLSSTTQCAALFLYAGLGSFPLHCISEIFICRSLQSAHVNISWHVGT